MNTTGLPRHADQRRMSLLLAAVTLVVIPHAFNLPSSVMAFFGVLVLWRFAILRQSIAPPNRAWLMLLTVAGAGLVFAEYQRFYGPEAGASLFVVGLGLKLMELKSPRDIYLVVFLAFFVAVTQYLFSQSIPMAAYTLVTVVLLITVLISFNSGDHFLWSAGFKLAGLMVMQAIPIMIILFVLFPRITGPLWKLPDDRRIARTGLSDTIEPGSISRLGLSQEPAFRVDFDGPPPPPHQRYWRGPVFWHTDGQRWTLSRESLPHSIERVQFKGQIYHYTVTLEPLSQRWVFALDLPARYPLELTQSAEYLLASRDKISERRRYGLTSYLDYATGPLSDREKALGLELPKDLPRRIMHLVRGWQDEAEQPADMIQRALQFFREQPFFYTLSPPPTLGNPVESFLFETRRGFCEHYATSFVVLMRSAGIPARVVTGYQGGQWNPMGRFLEVKQADAHAWAEVWLEETGWTRVDPTAAVAPERIEQGVDVDTQIVAGEVRFNAVNEAIAEQAFHLRNLLRHTRMVWASIDHAWDRWILGYGAEKQTKLLKRLGITDWRSLALWLSGLLALILLAIALLILPRRGRKTDRALTLYARFLNKMARRGLIKLPTEGPLTFAHRARSFAPTSQAEIDRITEIFVKIRYGRGATSEDIQKLDRAIKTFRL